MFALYVLHVNMNKWHDDIIMLYVDKIYLGGKGKKYATQKKDCQGPKSFFTEKKLQ